ncbi:MAG: type I methionyl aminopeptidase [Candidatus Dormibacteria bacterium]
MRGESFRLKKPDEIARMARSGEILGACLEHVATHVAPGVTLNTLDREAETFIRDHGCIPGFIGYDGFPKSICISVNNEVVHGIPGERVVQDGDIVSLDCGLILDGWWADSGLTVPCGNVEPGMQKLIDVTQEALYRAIEVARPGAHIGDIGHTVQTYVESHGYAVVKHYVGHGIGRDMHEPPQVPNYGKPGTGNELKPGYVIAIEPMVNKGRDAVRTLEDNWTVVTQDGSWSAYAEHTVAITEDGPHVLTVRPSERVILQERKCAVG